MSELSSRSKITSKGQTTIPLEVRKALDIGPRDRIEFRILEGGKVELKKAGEDSPDPVVAAYLEFLEADLLANPQKLSVLERDPIVENLLAGVEVENFELR